LLVISTDFFSHSLGNNPEERSFQLVWRKPEIAQR